MGQPQRRVLGTCLGTPKRAGGRLLDAVVAAVASQELSVLFLTCSHAEGEGGHEGTVSCCRRCSSFAAGCWQVTVLRIKGLLTFVVMSRTVLGVSPEKLSWSMTTGMAFTR
jgi:hypothetical protein